MKFKITDWILTGNIFPLKWGDTSLEIEEVFDNSNKVIEDLKNSSYPYIELDFVEFYFNNDNYKGLAEICVKNISVYKEIKTKFFDQEWLNQGITFADVSKKLTDLRIDWKIERGPRNQTPNILIKSNVLFCFDLYEPDETKSELMKIYIKK